MPKTKSKTESFPPRHGEIWTKEEDFHLMNFMETGSRNYNKYADNIGRSPWAVMCICFM